MSDNKTDGQQPDRSQDSISDGLNARPRNESIGQTAGAIPDDTGAPIEVDPEQEERIRRALLGDKSGAGTSNPEMPYDVDHAHRTRNTRSG